MDSKVYDKCQAFLRVWLQPVMIIVPLVLAFPVGVTGEQVGLISALLAGIGTAFGVGLANSSAKYAKAKIGE